MKFATFNVLADAYTGYADYSHADPALMQPGARIDYLTQQINDLDADVIGLQEADRSLVEAFADDNTWQSLWTQKGKNKPDGCLTLVKSNLAVTDHESHLYDDGTGHVFQLTRIGGVAIANTHIKWSPEDEAHHAGVAQTQKLLASLENQERAIILADCNGRPGGRVQTMVEQAGFVNLNGERPTAIVNGTIVALDLLATKGLSGTLIHKNYDLHAIPNETCASDHVPIVAEIIVD